MPATPLSWSALGSEENPVLGPAWTSNGHVFTSGVIGQNYKTGKKPESVEDQTELAIVNLKDVLEKSGSSLEKVFKVLMFISHSDYSGTVNKVYCKYFPQKPARSCVIVQFMDSAIKVELEAIASVD